MKPQTSAYQPATILRRMIPALLLGFLAFVVLAFLGDLQSVLLTIRDFNWKVFPIVIGFTLFNYLVRFLKWHYYLHQIGVRDFSVWQSARLFVAGFPLALTPGKVGEVLKGVWLNQQTGIPTARGVSVVAAERISDGIAVLFLSAAGVIAFPKYWPVFVLVLAFLISLIVVTQIRALAYWLLNILTKFPIIKKFSKGLYDFYEGSFSLFRPRSTFLAVLLGMLSWLGEGIGFYILLINLGVSPGEQSLAMAVFVLSFSTVIGAVTALPGGLGAAEASIAGMLVLVVGLDTAQASVATLLIRLGTLWFGVSLGLLVWVFSLELFGFKRRSGVLNSL